jgi:hypothetical protein
MRQARDEAQRQLSILLQGVAAGLFGSENTQRGTERLMDALQDRRRNKHLFYIVLEAAFFRLFPELDPRAQRGAPAGADSLEGSAADLAAGAASGSASTDDIIAALYSRPRGRF